MSNYKGLFTYDIDNHRYISVEQADGIISDMNYTVEPKYFYCISTDGSINKYEVERYAHDSWCKNGAKIIGNYFETREEAEKAVEKLMAWNRLRECGLIPLTWTNAKGGCLLVKYGIGGPGMMDCLDFDLLFGGEE